MFKYMHDNKKGQVEFETSKVNGPELLTEVSFMLLNICNCIEEKSPIDAAILRHMLTDGDVMKIIFDVAKKDEGDNKATATDFLEKALQEIENDFGGEA